MSPASSSYSGLWITVPVTIGCHLGSWFWSSFSQESFLLGVVISGGARYFCPLRCVWSGESANCFQLDGASRYVCAGTSYMGGPGIGVNCSLVLSGQVCLYRFVACYFLRIFSDLLGFYFCLFYSLYGWPILCYKVYRDSSWGGDWFLQ